MLTRERELLHTGYCRVRGNLSVVAGSTGRAEMNAAATTPLRRQRGISLSLFIIGSIAHCLSPAQAHDIYAHLTDRLGRSCCDNGDCRPAHYRITSAGVDMLVGDKWIAIPRGKLQYRLLDGDTGETGGGHWCGAPDEGHSYFTYCAILPPALALAVMPFAASKAE